MTAAVRTHHLHELAVGGWVLDYGERQELVRGVRLSAKHHLSMGEGGGTQARSQHEYINNQRVRRNKPSTRTRARGEFSLAARSNWRRFVGLAEVEVGKTKHKDTHTHTYL